VPELWKEVQFIVLDAPSQKTEFESRMNFIKNLSLPAHCKVIQQVQCEGNIVALVACSIILRRRTSEEFPSTSDKQWRKWNIFEST
jgi:hypothetical protein